MTRTVTCFALLMLWSFAYNAFAQDVSPVPPAPSEAASVDAARPAERLPGETDATNADLLRELRRLSTRIDAMSAQMVTSQTLAAATAGMVHQSEFSESNQRLQQLSDRVEQLNQLYLEQQAEIRKLRTDYDVVTEGLSNQMVEQRRLLEAISGTDSSGTPYLRMNAIMQQSPEGREEVARAVNSSLQRTGTLRVENGMASDQTVAINQTEYQIPANSSRDFTVPIGTVTTQLVGYEEPKHLTVAAPTYEQRLVIAPAQVVRRVISPADGGSYEVRYAPAQQVQYVASPTVEYVPQVEYYAAPTVWWW
ncbi:MAG: hypothetical protein ACOY3P_03905 [Planctomycetota bacterium]